MERLHPYRITLFAAPAALALVLAGAVYLGGLSVAWFWLATAALVPATVLGVILYDALRRF